MFEILLWAVATVIAVAVLVAWDGSRDVFHPVMFLGPLMAFLYAWMPMRLNENGGLDGFFQSDQLVWVQSWNLAGVVAILTGCLSSGARVPPLNGRPTLSVAGGRQLIIGGTITGLLGLACWVMSIGNVGGLTEAFSRPYSGGWDDSGYIRDGALLMFPGFILIATAALQSRAAAICLPMAAAFITPWMVQAALTSRRGPTFMIAIVLGMTWYMNRNRRPPILMAAAGALVLGLLILFLIANRGAIYLGSDKDFSTDISNVTETPDTGNEYIYGAGSILSAEQRQRFFWGRRYLAQVLVRPIPSAVWPTKYEDFGVPELTHNAGTGEGLTEALGWNGANGAAPGFIADLWLEFRWLNVAALFFIGRGYGLAWKKARLQGGAWIAHYTILSAISIYLVMQTMEAVIFRSLMMCVPVALTWKCVRSAKPRQHEAAERLYASSASY
jgi:hypothetical protein